MNKYRMFRQKYARIVDRMNASRYLKQIMYSTHDGK